MISRGLHGYITTRALAWCAAGKAALCGVELGAGTEAGTEAGWGQGRKKRGGVMCINFWTLTRA